MNSQFASLDATRRSDADSVAALGRMIYFGTTIERGCHRMKLLGAYMQIAYMTTDLHRAVRKWSFQKGVGPFVIAAHAEFESVEFDGRSTQIDVSLAFAFSGNMQIELITQHNDAPSVFKNVDGPTPHHLGVLTPNIKADRKTLESAGWSLRQHSISNVGTEVMFFSDAIGTELIELIASNPDMLRRHEAMRGAAAQWDGSNPLLSFRG
jgi:methylmalonyl-CoA/ethylmalonyl-CoA epimerase